MIRIVRSRTLDALLADRAALAQARTALAAARTAADSSAEATAKAEAVAEQLLRQLAQERAGEIQETRDAAEAEQLRKQLQQADVAIGQLRATLAAQPGIDTPEDSLRGALALSLLRSIYDEARDRGQTGPTVDIAAVVLGIEPLPTT
ncbi:hypothetical protein [Streptomyces sp. SCA2-2]|uniref:hypothetical protein n=1 Tax=Streptomyces sp. SCA2-2 TaxID=1563677 RepID=UPI001020CDD9|nr:hypothetical protein [Streptomyces sp. SCA2-2]RZE89172.1 hypothetical protein C0L86_28900 [Streptomyces sp. SCA2-2]